MAGNNEQNSRVARRKSQPKPPKKHWFRRIILSLAALFVHRGTRWSSTFLLLCADGTNSQTE